jgi:hypothetical protein
MIEKEQFQLSTRKQSEWLAVNRHRLSPCPTRHVQGDEEVMKEIDLIYPKGLFTEPERS